MNNFVKYAAMTVALMSSINIAHAVVEPPLLVINVCKLPSDMYNALLHGVDTKDSKAIIAKIQEMALACGNPDVVISIATVAGVPAATIEAALPNIPVSEVEANITAAVNDPAAFAPATAAGPAAGQANGGTGAPSSAGSANGGGFSGGGGGGGAGAVSGS